MGSGVSESHGRWRFKFRLCHSRVVVSWKGAATSLDPKCVRLLLRVLPSSSSSDFVNLRLRLPSSAYVFVSLRRHLSPFSSVSVAVPRGCSGGCRLCIRWSTFEGLEAMAVCVCVCVNGVCGISHGKSKGLCCVVMYSITYRPLRSFGHLLISTH